MMTFSNPRTVAEFNDWPIGSNHRGYCRFEVETKKGKQRVSRVTADKNGRLCKPKCTTYYEKTIIVDGSDGRTYVLGLTFYGFISVEESNLRYTTPLHPEEGQRFVEAKALFDAA